MKAASVLLHAIIGVPVMASTLATWFVHHLRGERARSELTAVDAWLDEPADFVDVDDRLDEATAALLG